MKKIILLTLTIFSAYAYVLGQTKCKNFKTGNYTYKEKPFNQTKVRRTKKFQFEA